MEKNFRKYKIKIIFILILLIQITIIIYAVTTRIHLHMDEYLSFGFISSKDMYIQNKLDFYNTWHSNDYFYEYLEINQNEVNDFSPVYDNQKNDVHPPLYYFLLRLISNFNVDNFTIWFAISLNIILFIISMCLVFLIGEKLFNNKKYSLLLCFIVGFNIGVIQIAIYIRMYQLLILSGLLLLYWHLCKNKKEILDFKDLLQLFFIICMGFLTQYYFLILLIAVYIVYFIQNIRKRQLKNLYKYTITFIFSFGMITLIFPYWIEQLLFSGRGEEAYELLLKRPFYLFSVLYQYFVMLNRDGFNFMLYVLIVILICFVMYAIYYKIRNKKQIKLLDNNGIVYIIFPTIFYFIVISCVSPYIELRYFSLIIINIIIILLYYLKKFGEYVIENDRYCYKIILIICIFVNVINLLKVDNNIFSYKDEEKFINSINCKLNLIYIVDDRVIEWYDAYVAFLKYENSIIVKNSENVVEKIIKIIKENKLEVNDYVIGIDRPIYIELKELLLQTDELKDFEFEYSIGRSLFLASKK